jgi:hypothetical protein
MSRFPSVASFVCAGAVILAAQPVAAEVAPKYQRLREMRAVLEHPGVADAFGEALVDRIEFVRRDLYRVHSGRCQLDAAIVGQPTPSGWAGPRRFEVRVGRKTCR